MFFFEVAVEKRSWVPSFVAVFPSNIHGYSQLGVVVVVVEHSYIRVYALNVELGCNKNSNPGEFLK